MRKPISCAAALSSEADLAQRRFMLVDPNNRLVADTLESGWNDKLRALAGAREERERARRRDQIVLDEAVRRQLLAMTTDFREVWDRQSTPNRERKRLLAYIVEVRFALVETGLRQQQGDATPMLELIFPGGEQLRIGARVNADALRAVLEAFASVPAKPGSLHAINIRLLASAGYRGWKDAYAFPPLYINYCFAREPSYFGQYVTRSQGSRP